jgi:hypothetical protein
LDVLGRFAATSADAAAAAPVVQQAGNGVLYSSQEHTVRLLVLCRCPSNVQTAGVVRLLIFS